MIFRPEHAENITSAYLFNQLFESVSGLFATEISKIIQPPTYKIVCVCISSSSIDKKIMHCCFSINDKIKHKNTHPT